MPVVPSGKLSKAATMGKNFLVGDGLTQCATTSKDDVGRFVARIIADPRTINRYVFAYGEVLTQQDCLSLVEKVTGEKPEVICLKPEKVSQLASAAETDEYTFWHRVVVQYYNTVWVREDNCPRHAKELGYLDAKDLYPHLTFKTFEDSVNEALRGAGDFTGPMGDDQYWNTLVKLLL